VCVFWICVFSTVDGADRSTRARARRVAANAMSEWKKVLTFLIELGRQHFPADKWVDLDKSSSSPHPDMQVHAQQLQSELWEVVMEHIGDALKDPRWLPLDEVKRDHSFANMHIRTIYDWICRREKFLRNLPPQGVHVAPVPSPLEIAPPIDRNRSASSSRLPAPAATSGSISRFAVAATDGGGGPNTSRSRKRPRRD